MRKIQITTPGIKRALKEYSFWEAISEYIWNGLDAGATKVDFSFTTDTLGGLSEIVVTDNGKGIAKHELAGKFTPFFESDKGYTPNKHNQTSTFHGKNGVGRLTFFKFASKAIWSTSYKKDDSIYNYQITIANDCLEKYSETEEKLISGEPGTKVTFSGIEIDKYQLETKFYDFIKLELAWFLELNQGQISISLDGHPLDYSDLIEEKEKFPLCNDATKTHFENVYIRWSNKLNDEYSKFYFLDAQGKEKFKKNTTFNNKGDAFYHSVFIKSNLFNSLSGEPVNLKNDSSLAYQESLDYRFVINEINEFLHSAKKRFLKNSTDKLIEDFEKNNAFPAVNKANKWEKLRHEELESVVRELYIVEPKLFSKLNLEQKKTFVRLLDLIIDAGETDSLFKIIEEIIDLSSDDRAELAGVLKVTKLTRIIKTIRFINDRYLAVEDLKKLVYDEALKANEVNHLQTMIENHYWLFGEAYSLVTAAEPDFEEALRRYTYLLRGVSKKRKISHPDKNKEMDIFATRQDFQNDAIHNIVLELKHPQKKLGQKELDQVKKYLSVIRDQPEFNASNMYWVFYLIGKSFDTSKYIEGELKNAEVHGEKGLVFKNDNCKVFVKKWSEVFAEFELRHRFITEKLEFERNKIEQSFTAKQIINRIKENTATSAPEMKVPSSHKALPSL